MLHQGQGNLLLVLSFRLSYKEYVVLKRFIQAFVLVFVLMMASCQPVMAQDVKTYIPPRATALMPTIKSELKEYYPGLKYPGYLPALFEHESCISFRHSKCFNGHAELRNNREHGVGVGQLTRAWDAKGNLRFDNLTDMRRKHPNDLGELSWLTIKDREDLQIRTTILMLKDLEKQYEPGLAPKERLAFVDSSYNGGFSHVRQARQICKVTRDCDAGVWFKNVEVHLPKSRAPDTRYGGRSMYDINTHHVTDILITRMPKYERLFK